MKLIATRLDQCDAALATRRFADPTKVIPGPGLAVREYVVAAHLLQFGHAERLISGSLRNVSLENAVSRELSKLLVVDLL